MKMRVAILGAGNIARSMAAAVRGLQERGEDVEPYAVGARELSRAEAFAKEFFLSEEEDLLGPSPCPVEKIKNYKHYFIDLLILAFPLLIGNLGHTLIGATDVFVVAKYKIDALAAISIANSILFTIFIFGIGLICAVSIVLANKRGSRQKTKRRI